MANDEFRSPATVPTPTQAMHPATKQYVDTAVAGATGTSTLRGATDYDNTTAPTDGQVIAWLNSMSKFRPLTLTPALIGAATSGHAHDLSAYALAADLTAKANDSAVVHNTGNENIGGQKTVPSGSGNQWIFNIAPQIAVGTLANQPVRRDDARVTADQAVGTASIRTLGTGALQAAAGDHTHTGFAATSHNHDAAYSALGHTHAYAAVSHPHTPDSISLVSFNLGNVANGGTLTVTPSRASVYRASATGAAFTLAMSGTTDMEVVNIEILATVATTMTFGGTIIETGGMAATLAIPLNKRWFGALRYVGSVGWFLLASAVQN